MTRSLDLREQTLRALEQGLSRSAVCEVFGIHRSTLRRWQVRQEAGQLSPLPSPGGAYKLTSEDQERLLSQLQAHPDDTVDEHLRRWQQEGGIPVSRATMGRSLLRANWTRKKRV